MSKRGFDFVAGILALTVLMSVMVLIALAVRIGSPGEVLFRQTRVGRYGRPFQLLKFRTMITGAESLGPRITVGGDVRITKVGRFLRSTKLDELPQIFNVLKGEISLVGHDPKWRSTWHAGPKLTVNSSFQ